VINGRGSGKILSKAMKKKKFYLTTAIPYVNAAPHIGFALEIVQADCLARYKRLTGHEVYFLTGTDDNALKNVQAAEKAKIPVDKFVEKNADCYLKLKEALSLTFDDFIRTSKEKHSKSARAFWQACQKGDIYKKKYRGLYCVGCECFLTEKDLVKGKCPEHKTKPELVEEENYFFRLSAYQDWLQKLIETDELKITPRERKNEILSFINQGLKDFSISRSKARAHGWGIEVPEDPSQIIYVWFDALINYISALDWHQEGVKFKKFWPADVHMIGKGIIRFHAVYWPAMLKSVGLSLPKTELVHGYVTVEGEKISKSLGNVIDPFKLTEKYGSDPIRYYLLREIPEFGDGDFSTARFKEVYNADLANGLGNLIARVAKLAEKSNFGFKPGQPKLCQRYQKQLNDFRFNQGAKRIWQFISQADKYVNQHQVWQLEGRKQQQALQKLVDEIRKIALHLQPFLPQTAAKIKEQFKGPKIKAQKPLFPRLT